MLEIACLSYCASHVSLNMSSVCEMYLVIYLFCIPHIFFFLKCNLLFPDGNEVSCSGGGGRSSPIFHLPADFFHPAAAAHPETPGNSVSPIDRGLSRLASPASWASLRSPGANSRPLSSQVLPADVLDVFCVCVWIVG